MLHLQNATVVEDNWLRQKNFVPIRENPMNRSRVISESVSIVKL